MPIQFVAGVGPHRAELLNRLGIQTVADLLFFFPRRYEDYNQLQQIDALQDGENASVFGEVIDVEQSGLNTSRQRTCVLIRQAVELGEAAAYRYLRAIWFNQPFMSKKFGRGQRVIFIGKPKWNATRWEMVHPKVTFLGADEQPEQGEILPVYRLTERLNQYRLRQMVAAAVQEYAELLEETFSLEFLKARELPGIQDAVAAIHMPRDNEQLAAAQRRLIYQELFVLQTALAMRRFRVRDLGKATPIALDSKLTARILKRFAFEFSDSQMQSVQEIARDMEQRTPMNRLLQGEVGSGKTAVAMFAMLMTVARNHQAILMAPTEILARQHLRNLRQLLAGTDVQAELWSSSVKERERRPIREAVADGSINILVGTQALAVAELEFDSLALAVVDEQHKFGVRQRAALRQQAVDPHYLVMTATPIPRTISMTLFGDLDLSTIRRREKSQATIHSYLGKNDEKQRWWDFFCEQLRKGRQGYVIAPLVDAVSEDADPSSEIDSNAAAVDESDSFSGRSSGPESTASAEQLYETLVNGPLEAFRVDLLHGRLSVEEKDAALLSFARGHTQVLVATTVVEVGIDVPNATVMTIESAERFGLSQLHQLRGRVGRGAHPGYVCLFTAAENASTLDRLNVFVECRDGFALAEQDMQLRGPGNIFGTRQHGMPPLRIANLVRDGKLLEQAREDAQWLIGRDPHLRDPEYARLRQLIFARYGQSLELSDVG